MGTETFDVVIIGAGSVGMPTAAFLAEQGIRPLVIDQFASPGQGSNKAAIGGIGQRPHRGAAQRRPRSTCASSRCASSRPGNRPTVTTPNGASAGTPSSPIETATSVRCGRCSVCSRPPG